MAVFRAEKETRMMRNCVKNLGHCIDFEGNLYFKQKGWVLTKM